MPFLVRPRGGEDLDALARADLGRRMPALNNGGLELVAEPFCQLSPENILGGGAVINKGGGYFRVAELVDSTDTADVTIAAYENDGGTTAANIPTVSTGGACKFGSASISIAWDPTTGTQDNQYVDLTQGTRTGTYPLEDQWSLLRHCNFIRLWMRSDGTMSAGEIELALLDLSDPASPVVISTANSTATGYIAGAAVGTTGVPVAQEFYIGNHRTSMIGKTIGIRLRNTNSSAQDTWLIQAMDAYKLSAGGKGPVNGRIRWAIADGAQTLNNFISRTAGDDYSATTAGSNDTTALGPVVRGGPTSLDGDIFQLPSASGKLCWWQDTGTVYARAAAAAVGSYAIGDPASVAAATTLDNDEAAGQSLGVWEEAATAGGDYEVTLGGGSGGGGDASLTNVVRISGTQTITGAKTFSSGILTSANVGTPGTGVTAVEYGDGYNHVTVLTLTAAALTPTVPANAEGIGAVIYSFPAGAYALVNARLIVTAFVADTATNAAEFGLGSLIASGDQATLGAIDAACEDIVGPQTIADVSSPATDAIAVLTPTFLAAGSHVVNFNAAATWNATIATVAVTCTVVLHWTFMGA